MAHLYTEEVSLLYVGMIINCKMNIRALSLVSFQEIQEGSFLAFG